jgi:succinate dehydrogenase hydrophobic anchor subunit
MPETGIEDIIVDSGREGCGSVLLKLVTGMVVVLVVIVLIAFVVSYCSSRHETPANSNASTNQAQ